MYNGVIAWIAKHEKLHYICRVIKGVRNIEFVRDVIDLQHDCKILRTEQKGDKNFGKVLYEIHVNEAGFFAELRGVLLQLQYAESMSLSPVVTWSKESPYYESTGVLGVMNPWEYYFIQPSEFEIDDLNCSFRVAKDKIRSIYKEDSENGWNSYQVTEKFVREMGIIFKKYIHLQPRIDQYIDDKIQSIWKSGSILGVHIRMGDMLGNFDKHPIVPELGDYIEVIKYLFSKYDYIFLATDDNRALHRMLDEFGDNVIYYDFMTRVDGEYSTYCVDSEEEKHNYMCGLEALLDMYTLAHCDGLIAGMSQLSSMARIAKASIEKEYEDLYIIDKGINHNDKKAPTTNREKQSVRQ